MYSWLICFRISISSGVSCVCVCVCVCVWQLTSGLCKERRFSWLSKHLLLLAGLCMSSYISDGVFGDLWYISLLTLPRTGRWDFILYQKCCIVPFTSPTSAVSVRLCKLCIERVSGILYALVNWKFTSIKNIWNFDFWCDIIGTVTRRVI